MSLLLRTSRIAAICPATVKPAFGPRSFMNSSIMALKESDRHNPEQAADNERHKQDALEKHKSGKGHWKPELASDSEEAVAADRSGKENNDSIEEMQKKTAEHVEKKHKHGTSQDPGL